MKTLSMKLPRHIIILIAFGAFFLLPVSHAAPELPRLGFAPELVDGVGKWYLNFETNPGYHYVVEESEDMVSWAPSAGGSFYGNGAEQKMYVCDGPMSTESTSSGGTQISGEGLWQLKTMTMKLQMQSGNLGSFQRLSRNSYTPLDAAEPLPSWDKELTLQLPSQTARWRYFPMLEWKDYTEHIIYWVDLHVHITDEAPPGDSFATTAEEPGELQIFDQLYSQLVGSFLTEGTAVPNTTPLPRKYARVRVTEIDVNGNGLWDWWEILYGWSPFALVGQPGYCDAYADDDGDTRSNATEQADGTDPKKFDTDGDGFHDGEDTDPKDPKKHPPPVTYLLVATKDILFFNQGSGEYYVHWKTENFSDVPFPEYKAISRYLTPAEMEGALAAPELPSNADGALLRGVKIPLNTAVVTEGDFINLAGSIPPDLPASLGNIAFSRCWLVRKPTETKPVKVNFLRVQKQTLLGDPVLPEVEPELITFEVKASKTVSDSVDLAPLLSPIAVPESSYRVTASDTLVPIEIKAHQTQNGPYGSAPKYNDSPSVGSATNLLSIWPNEEIILKVKAPAPFDQSGNFPPNFIKWSVPGHTFNDNTLEASMKWPLNFFDPAANAKEITVTIDGHEFKIHIKVQGVGVLSEAEGAALVPNAAPAMLLHSFEAKNYANDNFPVGPKRDAIRHAYWCSLSVSTFPVTAGDVPFISTGHEYDNRNDKQHAFNSTMDLKNNSVGTSVNLQVEGAPDTAAIRIALEQLYNAGEMFVWEVPPHAQTASEGNSEGILIKSNGTRIHQ